MIDQLVPLGELGVMLAIWKRLGDLRHDTNRNQRLITKLKQRVEQLEQLIPRRDRRRAD